ncbi:hypothetical protein OROHE_020030 [Orobanche hederae]
MVTSVLALHDLLMSLSSTHMNEFKSNSNLFASYFFT